MVTASFLVCLSFFLGVGLWSVRFSRGNRDDYYVASRSIPPWLVGLSAVATNNSGYMFIGVMGYTYATGLASVWLMVGWIVGDLLASMVVHRQLRQATARSGEGSFAGVLSHWYGQRWHRWQRLAGLLALIFLLAYTSAQLVAGSKALHVLLGWPEATGAIVGAVIVILYCLAGGIRASIWTDAAQSMVMIGAMTLLFVVAVQSLGGPAAAIAAMDAVPGFLDWFPRDLPFPGLAGGLLFALGWMFAGCSVIGQPHVMVRFMALDDDRNMVRARIWYYSWFTAFYALATGVGMLSRVYLAGPGEFDAELALPMMALDLLPPVLVGVVLAGIFAATMSTADSLILSCSAAITHDLVPQRLERPLWIKLTTAAVTVVALALALSGEHSVFALVLFAWSALASAFAPLLLVMATGGRPGEPLAVVMSLAGVTVAIGWRLLGWHDFVYEGMPGILTGLVVYLLGRRRATGALTAGPAV